MRQSVFRGITFRVLDKFSWNLAIIWQLEVEIWRKWEKEFKNIESRSLGSGSDIDKENIGKLHSDIKREINNINEFIFKPVEVLVALDD